MKYNQFTTEMKNSLNSKDFAIIRNLYQPIIGMTAVALYQIISDYHDLNKYRKTYFLFETLLKILDINQMQLKQARTKLEAVGLIRTFENADNIHYIIQLNKPLNTVAFRNNSLLFKQSILKIGEEVFERFELSNKEHILIKDDFFEISTKFQDIFSINSKLIKNTLEIPALKINNVSDAIKSLTAYQFIAYISNKKISPTQFQLVQTLQQMGFSSQSINQVSNYSYEINGKIVAKHIEVIAKDLFNKGVVSADEIKTELDHALLSKSNQIKPIKENKFKNKNIEWEDIFNIVGEF